MWNTVVEKFWLILEKDSFKSLKYLQLNTLKYQNYLSGVLNFINYKFLLDFEVYFLIEQYRAGADAIKKFTPSLRIPYFGV